jgi:hypothetical protein
LLQTLEFPVLAKQWRTQPAELDVVAAGVAVWRERITKLSELLRQGAVTAEVGGSNTGNVQSRKINLLSA